MSKVNSCVDFNRLYTPDITIESSCMDEQSSLFDDDLLTPKDDDELASETSNGKLKVWQSSQRMFRLGAVHANHEPVHNIVSTEAIVRRLPSKSVRAHI